VQTLKSIVGALNLSVVHLESCYEQIMHVWVIIHDQDTFENAHTARTIPDFVAVSEPMLRMQRNIGVLALTSVTNASKISAQSAV
jgi:hypothetical protein